MKFIVLTTDTCIKCKSLKSILDKVCNSTGTAVEFLDAMKEGSELRDKYNVTSVPYIILYKDSEVVYTHNGFMSESCLISLIDEYSHN